MRYHESPLEHHSSKGLILYIIKILQSKKVYGVSIKNL